MRWTLSARDALLRGAAAAGRHSAQALESIFEYTGDEQTFEVPTGVYQVKFVAIGGHGGEANGPAGGEAAEVKGNLDVDAGPDPTTSRSAATASPRPKAAKADSTAAAAAAAVAAAPRTSAPHPRRRAAHDRRHQALVAAGGGGGGVDRVRRTGRSRRSAGKPGRRQPAIPAAERGPEPKVAPAPTAANRSAPAAPANLGIGGAGGYSSPKTGPGGGGGGGYLRRRRRRRRLRSRQQRRRRRLVAGPAVGLHDPDHRPARRSKSPTTRRPR